MKPCAGDWRVRVEWKLEDLWVGVFWKKSLQCVDIWVCFIPCLPIHFIKAREPSK